MQIATTAHDLELLRTYYAVSPRPPLRHELQIDGVRVLSRLLRVREYFQTGRLTRDAIAAFEAIPDWSWGPVSAAERQFLIDVASLREVARHTRGHAPAAGMLDAIGGAGLRERMQRIRAAANRADFPLARRAMLEAIPGWGDHAYREHRAHRVPSALTTTERKRVNEQERAALRGEAAVAFFVDTYPALRRFATTHGHLRVPPTLETHRGASLRAVLDALVADAANGSLPLRMRTVLGTIPGWAEQCAQSLPVTEPVRTVAATRHAELRVLTAFIERQGHGDVGPRDVTGDGHPVGVYAAQMRRRWTSGEITPIEFDALRIVPGWSWAIEPRVVPMVSGVAAAPPRVHALPVSEMVSPLVPLSL